MADTLIIIGKEDCDKTIVELHPNCNKIDLTNCSKLKYDNITFKGDGIEEILLSDNVMGFNSVFDSFPDFKKITNSCSSRFWFALHCSCTDTYMMGNHSPIPINVGQSVKNIILNYECLFSMRGTVKINLYDRANINIEGFPLVPHHICVQYNIYSLYTDNFKYTISFDTSDSNSTELSIIFNKTWATDLRSSLLYAINNLNYVNNISMLESILDIYLNLKEFHLLNDTIYETLLANRFMELLEEILYYICEKECSKSEGNDFSVLLYILDKYSHKMNPYIIREYVEKNNINNIPTDLRNLLIYFLL